MKCIINYCYVLFKLRNTDISKNKFNPISQRRWYLYKNNLIRLLNPKLLAL